MSFAGEGSSLESEGEGTAHHQSPLPQPSHPLQQEECTRDAGMEVQEELDPEAENLIANDRLHDLSPLTKTVVVYENERYQMTTLGWSKNGLLPTDRKHISTRNGKVGWASLEAADMALITHGWTWTSAWSVDHHDPSAFSHSTTYNSPLLSTDTPPHSNTSEAQLQDQLHECDAEGWRYATNFGSMEGSSSAIKGLTHFVRRRRRSRQQAFVGPSLAGGTCDHCDSEAVRYLADCLLEALTQTSLHENPGDYSEAATNALKNTLLELLGLASRQQTGLRDMSDVHQCVDKFFITVINNKSAWAKLSSIVGADYLPERLPERAVEVSRVSFPPEERDEVARMLIRKYDSAFQLHCPHPHCGTSCPSFFLSPCPNLGCSMVMSAKHHPQHQEVCPFAPLLCEQGCGDRIPRKEMQYHISLTCIRRPATCPYACIGCKSDGLTVDSLQRHLKAPEHTSAHLLLALTRMNEQQSVIKNLNQKVQALESSSSAQQRAIRLLQGGAVATTAALRSSEREAEEASHRELKELEARLEKRERAVESRVKALDGHLKELEREGQAQRRQIDEALLQGGDRGVDV